MNAPAAFMITTLQVVEEILDLYIWLLVVGAVLSWLVAFNIVNPRNRAVQVVGDFIYRITEPVLRPIRRFVPPVNGLDLSPMILIFIIYFIRLFLFHLVIG